MPKLVVASPAGDVGILNSDGILHAFHPHSPKSPSANKAEPKFKKRRGMARSGQREGWGLRGVVAILGFPGLLAVAGWIHAAEKPAAPPASSPATEASGGADRGQALIRNLGCPICHDLPGLETTIRDEAPNLTFEGEMVRPEWLFAFLKDPAKIRPAVRGRMPDFRLTDREALALTEYLHSLKDGTPEPPAARRYQGKTNPEYVEAGKKLTTKDYFDCFKCHLLAGKQPEGKAEDWAPDLDRIRHRFLPEFFVKWFADPSKYRPGTKMPGFFPDKDAGPDDILEGDESRQVVALRDYLFSFGPVQRNPDYARARQAHPDVRPLEGRRLMVRLNCVGCHEVASLPNGKRVGPSLAHQGSRVRREWLVAFLRQPGVIKPEYNLMVGGAGAGARMPSFSFTEDEASAIADFMEKALVAPEAKDPFNGSSPSAEVVRRGERLFAVKFCNNCHRIQERPGGIGPDLTHAGRRLQPGWTANFIQRPTHYLDTRMPNLQVNAEEAKALAAYILGEKP